MNITLSDVDKDNYEEVCDPSVAEKQYDYVADNTWSLVEAKFKPSYANLSCQSWKKVFMNQENQRVTLGRRRSDTLPS